MRKSVHIAMLGGFHIYVDGESMDQLVSKSRKGMLLLQYLALQHGESVPIYRLIDALWSGESSSNPESALKTLVSRLRVMLARSALRWPPALSPSAAPTAGLRKTV